ncbi:flagellar basal body rod protein FlgC [Candidatus Phycosocius spiralis]|uniref:Flagellar basal-body rod protein FlgC n=1 Tax=Candidatus Phycosocius spiralis TaxID=2815099 RepID=A0ABQ4PZE3_9PROT|nr:flagellar basal body rod protein FlgC [Candidatus Phycosocius spiralis]GIU68058.1 flagellar basal-body rod protein FlgC [Candidatus Phycosocius spiralis]
MDVMKISASALDVEGQRLQIIALNLANMNSTRVTGGGSFQPLRLYSGPNVPFGAHLNGEAQGVKVVSVEPMENGVRLAYEPNHPDANDRGYVAYPNIDHAGEMTLMIRTSRVYEANLAVLGIAHQMYNRALEMAR